MSGPLAQLAEQLTLNQLVAGSSPAWVTTSGLPEGSPLCVSAGRSRYGTTGPHSIGSQVAEGVGVSVGVSLGVGVSDGVGD